MTDLALDQAALAIALADALLIGAGAGIGVDSGLPDFRGSQGFWRAYPPYERLGLDFVSLANPRWFDRDPTLAWGFYGHRMKLYRQTTPHEGFTILRRWAGRVPRGEFVFTSNVDGQFERAGIDRGRIVLECGGTLIRINPREPDVPTGHVSIPLGALAALRAIEHRLTAPAA
jgi:NAD-dependent SIR2 family protein deacetylase